MFFESSKQRKIRKLKKIKRTLIEKVKLDPIDKDSMEQLADVKKMIRRLKNETRSP
jgi:hypothetical protein